jgi:putative tryptophan/tyrosine transport system substrate-binding protein
MLNMKRREFITLLGGAAAWPLAAGAQQPAMPVIGLLDNRAAETTADRLRGFHRGLRESGYVEGESVSIVYRWADGDNRRLPELAADLIRRQVAVIAATGGTPTALAAKAATATIPIVFAVPEDPVGLGLVASLPRPGGNLTGVNFFNAEVAAKRLELMRELVPSAKRVAVLVNPTNAANMEANLRQLQPAAETLGAEIEVVRAASSREIDAAFAAMARERPDMLFVMGDALFNSRRLQLAMLAARHMLPASYASRDYPVSGGLMSYGTDVTDAFRQVGFYVGRILKGARPADLPAVQAAKFQLVINAQTARLLDLTVPPQLLARADEVIE